MQQGRKGFREVWRQDWLQAMARAMAQGGRRLQAGHGAAACTAGVGCLLLLLLLVLLLEVEVLLLLVLLLGGLAMQLELINRALIQVLLHVHREGGGAEASYA